MCYIGLRLLRGQSPQSQAAEEKRREEERKKNLVIYQLGHACQAKDWHATAY
jgi:hypothetical protein